MSGDREVEWFVVPLSWLLFAKKKIPAFWTCWIPLEKMLVPMVCCKLTMPASAHGLHTGDTKPLFSLLLRPMTHEAAPARLPVYAQMRVFMKDRVVVP